MMSLVAYDASSDEDNDSDEESTEAVIRVEPNVVRETKTIQATKSTLSLPAPKQIIADSSDEDDADKEPHISFNLPQPRLNHVDSVEEDNDEFLNKKAIPVEKPPPMKRPSASGPVRITIPSLSSFKEDEHVKKSNFAVDKSIKASGLLNLLPKPKSEMNFTRIATATANGSTSKNPFIPHSVTNRKKSLPANTKTSAKAKAADSGKASDSEDSGNENDSEDFFSLNKKYILPEVSANEIQALVAKKAAKMAQVSAQFDTPEPEQLPDDSHTPEEGDYQQYSSSAVHLEEEAAQHLLGSQAKRKRQEEINIVELSHEQVMPSQADWMRNALASSTQYVPKGKLTDDELIPGSKRKHQITYLAHQAKANEAELQAMWAANRQSRRQTQSKYGF